MPKAVNKKAGAMETASFVLSVVACILAVIMPYATYTWMQNDVRIQKIKATSLRAFGKPASGASVSSDGAITIDKATSIVICNDGNLPVGEVEVVFENRDRKEGFFEQVSVTTDPYRKITTELSDSTLVASFEKPLPPGERVAVIFHKKLRFKDKIPEPDDDNLLVWVRSEASPTIPVYGLTSRSD